MAASDHRAAVGVVVAVLHAGHEGDEPADRRDDAESGEPAIPAQQVARDDQDGAAEDGGPGEPPGRVGRTRERRRVRGLVAGVLLVELDRIGERIGMVAIGRERGRDRSFGNSGPRSIWPLRSATIASQARCSCSGRSESLLVTR